MVEVQFVEQRLPPDYYYSSAKQEIRRSAKQEIRRSAKPSRTASAGSSPDISVGGLTYSFALNHRPRATRSRVPKARTGCVTCKKRHVKCDEAKPSCQRCIKWKGSCDGYQPKPAGGHIPGCRQEGGFARMLLKPTESIFSSQMDHDYFAAWKGVTNSLSGGLFPSNLFSFSMPQLGREEPPIRHAIMALGGMNVALESADLSITAYETSVKTSAHYPNALANYGRAMRLIRSASPGERTVRNAILCCVLFMAFEALNNDRDAMIEHIRHGRSLLRQFVRSQRGPCARVGRRSPAPNIVEHEVFELFRRLEFHTWTANIIRQKRLASGAYCGVKGEEDAEIDADDGDNGDDDDEMPERFSDVSEARQWLDLVQHHVVIFGRKLVALKESYLAEALRTGHPAPDLCDIPEREELSTTYLDRLHRWDRAFQPIYTRARDHEKADANKYFQLQCLRALYLWAYAAVFSAAWSDRRALKLLEPVFDEILHGAEFCLPHLASVSEGSAEPFTLDNGPVPAVYIVAVKARRGDTRRRALRLLGEHPRRDGVWDSRAAYALARHEVEVEDEYAAYGMGEEEIWAALRDRRVRFDGDGGDIYACAPRRDSLRGEWAEDVRVLTW